MVIPEEIRLKMGFLPGTQFIVIAEKDVVILKTIASPSIKEFDSLIASARVKAKKGRLISKILKKQ